MRVHDMKRRLLLMALASIPVFVVAGRLPKRGAGKPGGPLDPRRRDGNDEKQGQTATKASEEKKGSGEEKSEESSQKGSND